MSQLTVIARIKAKPGREAELEQELRAIIVPTHKEAGCLRYTLHRSMGDPAFFVTIERWASKEAVEQHMATPHIQALLKKGPDLLASLPDIQAYELLREGQPDKGDF
jgi:quinol monooxygenase YgiN